MYVHINVCMHMYKLTVELTVENLYPSHTA